jgi:23S rRNA pseudouridine1911/1915/1917 synthase
MASNPSDYNRTLASATGRRFVLDATHEGLRLDQALAALLPEYSRSRLQDWIRCGAIRVDGIPVAAKVRMWSGARVDVEVPEERPVGRDAPEDLPLSVVYEDDDLVVVDKPAGLVVHPGSGNPTGTLLNALLHRIPALDALPRAGIVHRLDKDTSGLMVVAKTLTAHTDLVRQLQARTVTREYRAVVTGHPEAEGEVDAPVGRHPTQRVRMAVVQGGRSALTRYRVLERLACHSVVECRLATGRTHQIRVHMQSIGHALLGDPVYRAPRAEWPAAIAAIVERFPRQALHAARLALVHPADRRVLEWHASLPEDLAVLIADLRAAGGGR